MDGRRLLPVVGLAWELARTALLLWIVLFLIVAPVAREAAPGVVLQQRLLVVLLGAGNLLAPACYALFLGARDRGARDLLINVLRLAKFVGLFALTLVIVAAPGAGGVPAVRLAGGRLGLPGPLLLDGLLALDLLSMVVLLSYKGGRRSGRTESVGRAEHAARAATAEQAATPLADRAPSPSDDHAGVAADLPPMVEHDLDGSADDGNRVTDAPGSPGQDGSTRP